MFDSLPVTMSMKRLVRRDVKRIGLPMTEVMNPIFKPRCFHLALEVREWRLKHVVVVIVDWDRALRIDDLHHLHPLRPIHRDHDAQNPRPAQVQERKMNIRVAARDLL